ncbi:MAG TPA: hypothetical protein VF844_19025, partial [Ktedonobacteraceae bacterium]
IEFKHDITEISDINVINVIKFYRVRCLSQASSMVGATLVVALLGCRIVSPYVLLSPDHPLEQ